MALSTDEIKGINDYLTNEERNLIKNMSDEEKQARIWSNNMAAYDPFNFGDLKISNKI